MTSQVRGVTLDRNVIAKASLDLAVQQIALAKAEIETKLKPNYADVAAAAEIAVANAEKSALYFDDQMRDELLMETHEEELHRLCEYRESAISSKIEAAVGFKVRVYDASCSPLLDADIRPNPLLLPPPRTCWRRPTVRDPSSRVVR